MSKARRISLRIMIVAGLSVMAAIAGIITATADQPTKTNFKGSYVRAEWNGFDPNASNGSGAYIEGTDGKTGPGQGTPTNTAWSSGSKTYWDGSTGWNSQQSFSASGDGTTTVSAKQNASSISGTLSGALPGSYSEWHWDNGWSSSGFAITAYVNAALSADSTYTEHSITYRQSPAGWVRVHRKGTTSQDAKGIGGITLVDANGNVNIFVPDGTPTYQWGNNIVSVSSEGDVTHN